jgi:hypothetical protein
MTLPAHQSRHFETHPIGEILRSIAYPVEPRLPAQLCRLLQQIGCEQRAAAE